MRGFVFSILCELRVLSVMIVTPCQRSIISSFVGLVVATLFEFALAERNDRVGDSNVRLRAVAGPALQVS